MEGSTAAEGRSHHEPDGGAIHVSEAAAGPDGGALHSRMQALVDRSSRRLPSNAGSLGDSSGLTLKVPLLVDLGGDDTQATFIPSWAARTAATYPPGPLPTIIRSYFSLLAIIILYLQNHSFRVFDKFLDAFEKGDRFSAVHNAVVIA